ncbi:Uncharacterized protein TPAR_00994 [Tolypocladium paradoxum]|uniref:SUR7 family protein pun1 n=1 Tax=Tolypocladium paradoxum TaxID=94208 RepID=A0A2S4L8R6_9HYPO|nr:Uncharacterized protein TPAR_00994 [Tolypocladium paradoxum]
MAPIARFIVLVPLVLALVSFVLTSLALFSGHKQGFMEDYAVVRLNTSMIGRNILDKAKDGGKDGGKTGSTKDGLLGDVKNWWDDVKGDAKDQINGIKGGVADKLASKLGVSQWYSLHVMDSCEGNWSPNATAPNPSLNVTNCTTSSPSHRLNLTDILDHELKVGPLKLNLSDINWPDSIQDKLDVLNDALLALFIVYVLAMGFSGLSMLLNLGALLLPGKTGLLLLNLIVGSLGGLACTIGSIVVTVAGSKGVREINDKGAKVGISAERGTQFYLLSWIATGFMLAVAIFWLAQFLALRRKKKAELRHGGKEAA